MADVFRLDEHRFLPGANASLTSSNFHAAFDSAMSACQSAGGGTVVIPAGVWMLTEELTIAGTDVDGDAGQIYIEGAGQAFTTLKYPGDYTGNGFNLKGSPPQSPWHWGGISRLSMTGNACAGKAIVIDAQVGTVFRDLCVQGFTGVGGTGVYCRDFVGGDNNSQDLCFDNCNISANYNNFDVQQFGATMVNMRACSAVNRCFLIDSSLVRIYGGNIQSGCPVSVEVSGEGGCFLVFDGLYHEGNPGTVFQFGAPTSSANFITVSNMTIGSNAAIFCDVQGPYVQVMLSDVHKMFDASTSVKARNMNMPLTITNPGSTYDAMSSKFDLDAASLAQLFYQNGSYIRSGSTVLAP